MATGVMECLTDTTCFVSVILATAKSVAEAQKAAEIQMPAEAPAPDSPADSPADLPSAPMAGAPAPGVASFPCRISGPQVEGN